MSRIPDITRRDAIAGLALSASVLPMAHVSAADKSAAGPGRLTVAARSPWLVNGVAVAPDGTLFLGLPRFDAASDTPSIARIEADGTLAAFPGGQFNGWKPGADSRDALVNVNAIHIFHDGTLWAVDQGTPAGGSEPEPGAQKLVRLDPRTGSLLTILRFGPDVLPLGARMNDLRIHDNMIYVTDSGLGGIIVHDLTANRTIRRLSGHPLLRANAPIRGRAGRVLENGSGQRPEVHSDMIELDADGLWLYWMAPAGPIRRLPTAALADAKLDDRALARLIETVAEIPSIGGSVMDTLGNIYLSDAEHRRITVLAPSGKQFVLTQDERLSSPDALFIGPDRRLYIPASQIEHLPQHADGADQTAAPFLVLCMPLPEVLEGRPLGMAVTGRRPDTGLSNFHGIEHVAMTVPDHDAAVRFLEQAFGATKLYSHIKKTDPPVTYEQVGRINALAPGTTMVAASQMRFANGANIEIFELEGLAREQAAGINDVGLVHFSVVVDDIREAGARFVEAGGTMLEGPFDLGFNEVGAGNQNWFGRMPWGTWVEFMTFRSPLRYDPGAVAERWLPMRG